MRFQLERLSAPVRLVLLLSVVCPSAVRAEERAVRRGDNLQAALNEARPGDVLLLQPGAEFVGNFVLAQKDGEQPIVLRSDPSAALPPTGVRIGPAHAPQLARLRSPNSASALRLAPGAHHWELRYLEFAANQGGYGDIIQIGDGSSSQNTLNLVPHDIVLAHLYIHGDRLLGQKRCVALNAARVTIRDSHISECKAVGQDSQAIGGWNGPGPYTIANNYLEGAGENFLLGGADPAITNLVADGVAFRRNLVSRPMAWRAPIVGTPQSVAATSQAGGALQPGTYAYRIVARRPVGMGGIARSTASAEASVPVSEPGSAVRVTWQAVPDATEYRVYGRSTGAENIYWTVTGTAFTDTGGAGTAEAVPTSTGTVWSVKNLFELKNARNVVIEENIFENHWRESQPGYAIVFTPRNSQGTCSWCVIEHVRFERNIVRNVAAGINLLGYDNTSPTQQAADIAFRQNLFSMSTTLGGNGWFLQIGDAPRDVVVEHNTIDSNGNAVVYAYGGSSTDPREIYGFRMLANAARHGSYGINGQYFAYGNAIINGFFPGAVFSANYLAGAAVSRYPAGTLVDGAFADQFLNPAASDFTVRDTSRLKRAAPDGSDIGVNYPELAARVSRVVQGIYSPESGSAPPPAPPSNVRVVQ